jgi:hypothetical protein
MNGEGEERKEIEARLHFAGITRSRLARRLIMSFARDSQVQPTSVLTIHLTCLARPSSCKPLHPPPTMASARSLMRLGSGRPVASAARSMAPRAFSSSPMQYAAKASTQPGSPEPENMRQAQRPRT